MRHILAIAITAALVLAASVADTAAKKKRYVRHTRPPAVQYAPAPRWPIERPLAYGVPPGTCIQDEGYGRWTYCGQGRR